MAISGARGGKQVQYQHLVALADGLRDQCRFSEAARAYESALNIDSRDPAIWIQLGNMLKDSHDLRGAESAYKRSLTLDGNCADCYVQLGRSLKLQGRREEALEVFSKALKVDLQSRDAAEELVSLGEYWRVQQQSGLGVSLQHELLSTVRTLKQALREVEAKLPAITSLSSIIRCRYDLFRSLYKEVGPPGGGVAATRTSVAVVIFDCDVPRGELIQAMDDLRKSIDVGAIAITRSTETSEHIRRVAHGLARGGLLAESSLADVAALQMAVSQFSDKDWTVICRIPIQISEKLPSWLEWTAQETDAIAAYVWFAP